MPMRQPQWQPKSNAAIGESANELAHVERIIRQTPARYFTGVCRILDVHAARVSLAGFLIPAPAAATDEHNVIEQLQDGSYQSGDVGERGGVQHLIHAAGFFFGADDAGLRE